MYFYTANTSMCECTFLCTKLQETLHKCCLSRTKLVFPLILALEEGEADLRELEQMTVSVLSWTKLVFPLTGRGQSKGTGANDSEFLFCLFLSLL